MGTLSIWHWLIVILVIVLLFGSKKIPDLAKGIGQGLREFKKALKEDEKEAPKEGTAAKDSSTDKPDKKDTAKV
jgi:sec-independent protein translocase protein TatA